MESRFGFALLLVRIAVAIVFLYHGSAILFGWFDGPGPVAFAGLMHAPVMVAYLVGLAQFAGALAVLTGVFHRLGAVCIMIVMLGAIFLVHLPHGFSVAKGGYEFALTEFLLALALLITGPGPWSLNSILPAPLRKF
jgi:putative oxidoreductase